MTRSRVTYRIARRAGKQGAHPPIDNRVGIEKDATSCNTNNHLLKCKKSNLISTFNTQTLNSSLKMGEITAQADKYGIDIICIQEHRLYHEEIILKHNNVGKMWTFITSSAWKNSINATIGGIGVLLSPKAQKSLDNIEMITPRIMIATFNGNPKTTLI